MITPLRGDINSRGEVRIRGWKILGRERHESSEEKDIIGRRKSCSNFRVEARLPSIKLSCLVSSLLELETRELDAKVAFNLRQ